MGHTRPARARTRCHASQPARRPPLRQAIRFARYTKEAGAGALNAGADAAALDMCCNDESDHPTPRLHADTNLPTTASAGSCLRRG